MSYVRTNDELLDRLASRIVHLRGDAENLKAGDLSYAGRVADGLRTLVIQTKTNEPLLLSLAEKYGDNLSYTPDAPPHLAKSTTLAETLEQLYQAKYEGRYNFSIRELIKGVADKEGAHEDPTFTQDHIEMKSEEYNIGGYPPYVYQLIIIAELVVSLGDRMVQRIQDGELQKNV